MVAAATLNNVCYVCYSTIIIINNSVNDMYVCVCVLRDVFKSLFVSIEGVNAMQ